MNYGEIKYFDIANGAGVRVSLFVSGCRHRCKECFNQEAWKFVFGKVFTPDIADAIMFRLDDRFIDGLSILGGEPLEPENQFELVKFLHRVKTTYPEKDIWMWTGFVFEDLMEGNTRANTEYLYALLSYVDVLVDGPFMVDNKDITLRFRGSSNQRILDLQKSLKSKTAILWTDGPVMSSRKWKD